MADPFLLQRGADLYMFYETKSTEQQKGQIGVAVSRDGGRSFQHQAVVLDLPWHLSYPFVFEHKGQVRTHTFYTWLGQSMACWVVMWGLRGSVFGGNGSNVAAARA